MKKSASIFISIVIITLLVGCTNENYNRYSLNSGRDTVISFGDTDGRFAVSRSGGGPENPYWDLFDIKNQKSIDIIDNYIDVKPYAYTIGKKGYTRLNYDTGEYIQSKNLIDFTDKDIKIFKKLKSEKIPEKR